MFILCTGTKAIYNTDKLTRYYVDEVEDDDDEPKEDDEMWAIVADADTYAYRLGYYETEDEANDAMLDLMKQMQNNEGWIMLKS